jgi:hypothetical protein
VRRSLAAFAVVAVMLSIAGPASGEASASTYVGRVQGTDVYIAISRDGRKIGGYVCDNGNVSRWLEYTWLRSGRAPLVVGVTDERIGTVRISGRSATGTIELDGRRRSFRARLTRSRDGGLFFAVAKQPNRLLVAGWILHPNGTQRGAISGVDTQTLRSVPPRRAPTLDRNASTVEIPGEDPGVPPVDTEPQPLVVINIIAVLIGLLLTAVQ